MTTYQIRNGKPSLGYMGTGPTREEYETMQRYQRQKQRLRVIRQHQKEDFTL